jgi:hypothetical protein
MHKTFFSIKKMHHFFVIKTKQYQNLKKKSPTSSSILEGERERTSLLILIVQLGAICGKVTNIS